MKIKGKNEVNIKFWMGKEENEDEEGVEELKKVELDDYIGGDKIKKSEKKGNE